MATIPVRYRIAMYAVVICGCLAAGMILAESVRPKVYSIPSSKVDAYLAHKDSYRMLFIGDSRTYTDIQPRVTGPITGRTAYNLASFGLWMPVQYLEFRDVFGKIPPGTVVVWSLSHHNFMPIGDRWWIPGQYKFTLSDAAEYLQDGYPASRIIREYEESPYSPVDRLVSARKLLMRSLETRVWTRPAPSPSSPQPVDSRIASRAQMNQEAAVALLEALRQDHNVNIAAPVVNDGVVTSIETTRTDGGYDRILIDREFFLTQQRKLWPNHGEDRSGCQVVPNAVYMRTFSKILALISRYRLRVVLNYIEDAPGSWTSESDRRCARQFMADTIVPILAQHGIEFIAPDFYPVIHFSNDYYFDDSHLITEGAALYSQMLGEELRQVLTRKNW